MSTTCMPNSRIAKLADSLQIVLVKLQKALTSQQQPQTNKPTLGVGIKTFKAHPTKLQNNFMITWTTWGAGLSPAEAAWFAACCTWWITALFSNPRCDACFAHDSATATEVLQWVYHRLYPTSQAHISFLDLLQDAQNANLLNKIMPRTRACIPCGCLVVESYEETQTTVHPIIPYFLPGWWSTPLKNHGVRQLEWFSIPNCFWKVIIHSMVPVTTNQINFHIGGIWLPFPNSWFIIPISQYEMVFQTTNPLLFFSVKKHHREKLVARHVCPST